MYDILLACQYTLGMFTNISLSVHPKLKTKFIKQFGLESELFGTFWNTDKNLRYGAGLYW